jgi:DME family drug/metabolite transporter
LFSTGLARLSAATVGTLSLAEPLAAALLGVLVLGEHLSATALAGCALLLGGLAAVSLRIPGGHPERPRMRRASGLPTRAPPLS